MPDPTSLTLYEQLVPFLIPPMVAILVHYFDQLPKWVVPTVVVPFLGAAGQSLAAVAGGGEVNLATGLMLGAFATALRESGVKIGKAGKAAKDGYPVDRMSPRRTQRDGTRGTRS